MPAAFTQPGDHLLAEPCSLNAQSIELKLSHPILELDDSPFSHFYPWLPNVFFCYVQMSIMSVMTKCLISFDIPNVHVITLVTCGHTCHMWRRLCGHPFNMLSHLSQVVTYVTCGHICHRWLQMSHVVTLVTCVHTCHIW